MHGDAAPPSSEHVTLVGEPAVRHEKLAERDTVVDAGTIVNVIVGAPTAVLEPIDQVYDALLDPAELDTRTTNWCVPAARPAYVVGDEHGDATPPSSEQVTLVGEPVVDHANDAVVDVVDAAGADVSDTVGTPGDGAGAVTLQEYAALFEPALEETVTTKRCCPVARPV